MKPNDPVEIRRRGVLIARGYFYGQISPTQVAVRSKADPSQIGLFLADDVQPALWPSTNLEAEKAKRVAHARGWLTDSGWIWERERSD